MARQATDSFVIEVNGAPVFVSKGEVLPESHPVLKQLGKDTQLFRPWEEETPPPGKTTRSRSG